MKMRMNIKNHNFSLQEIRIRALGVYIMIDIWVGSYFYKLIMEPLSSNFKKIAEQLSNEGKIDESKNLKVCSKILKRFLGVMSFEENEQVLIFFVWLLCNKKFREWFEDQKTAVGFSNSLREFFLKEGGIKLTGNYILSKDNMLFRKEMLEEYNKYNGLDILGPGGAYQFFTHNLADAIVFETSKKRDNDNFDKIRHTAIISYGLLTAEPLRSFIQNRIYILIESTLKDNIDITKKLIENMSRASQANLSEIYGV